MSSDILLPGVCCDTLRDSKVVHLGYAGSSTGSAGALNFPDIYASWRSSVRDAVTGLYLGNMELANVSNPISRRDRGGARLGSWLARDGVIRGVSLVAGLGQFTRGDSVTTSISHGPRRYGFSETRQPALSAALRTTLRAGPDLPSVLAAVHMTHATSTDTGTFSDGYFWARSQRVDSLGFTVTEYDSMIYRAARRTDTRNYRLGGSLGLTRRAVNWFFFANAGGSYGRWRCDSLIDSVPVVWDYDTRSFIQIDGQSRFLASSGTDTASAFMELAAERTIDMSPFTLIAGIQGTLNAHLFRGDTDRSFSGDVGAYWDTRRYSVTNVSLPATLVWEHKALALFLGWALTYRSTHYRNPDVTYWTGHGYATIRTSGDTRSLSANSFSGGVVYTPHEDFFFSAVPSFSGGLRLVAAELGFLW